MIWVIIVAIVVYFIYKFVNESNKVTEKVEAEGGMKKKYHTLLDFILTGHPEARILQETRTFISAGVSNYGGSTMFYIQQSPGGQCIIQYEVKNNPMIGDFRLQWTFPDDMDQTMMLVRMTADIQKKCF